ncbi:MAG: hypothetical protein CGW95_07615 [Phenylobacterium zucineum]|nr:MAG: hypothetical protein CGW95_07615 [Phenylobacterium zucineum]
MRYVLGGFAIALSVLLSGCSKPEAPVASGTVTLALPLDREGHGVLTAQTADLKDEGGGHPATVAMTPNWWVGNGAFKIVWYAGLSQTKRFFVISPTTGKLPPI